MTFTYPAVFMPHKNDKGYHVTFPDLQDAVEHAREADYNWLYLEIEEKTFEFPPQTHVEDIRLEEGEFLKQIMVTVKLLPDND